MSLKRVCVRTDAAVGGEPPQTPETKAAAARRAGSGGARRPLARLASENATTPLGSASSSASARKPQAHSRSGAFAVPFFPLVSCAPVYTS